MKYLYILALLTIFSTSSCEKVIDLKVSDTEQKMVFEAKYDAVKEIVSVKISKTIDVFSADDFPQISGAIVEIIDANNVSTPLIDQGDGTYLLENYVPIYNSQYTIKILVEGETYEASDRLVPVVPLDSLSSEFQEESVFQDEGYVVYMNATDPLGPNYYRAIREVNGEYKNDLEDQFLFDDSFSEGNTQSVPLFSELYQVDDTITVELISYSEKSFTYYQELQDIAGGSENSAAPANPTSSWSKTALGHFAVFGYDTKTIVIEE